MKKIKTILKWTGLVLLTLITGLAVATALRQNLQYDAPYPDITASKDSSVIARGKHLVFGSAHCINCHNPNNPDSLVRLGLEVPLTGGFKFAIPLGDIYSKNITPDSATGIGSYTDAEIARALRYGVHPDGTVVFDFMPFHNMSDEDLTAVISYLRAQKPVYNKVPDHDLNILGKVVKAFMVKPVGPDGPVPATVTKDTTYAYGRYMAMSVAECNGCHTLRDMSGAFIGEPFAGGGKMEEGGIAYYPPNLTTDPGSRIAGWSQDDFINRFRKGRIIPGSPMPWDSYNRMDDVELKAIYQYLSSLKPAKTPEAIVEEQLAANK